MQNDTTFIETQLPVSKLSKESYKERKANYSQTLTGLGKWWGRKPLVLVRATLLGLLMPASDDQVKDREIFLKLMTMDEEGLRRRNNQFHPNRSRQMLFPTNPGLQPPKDSFPKGSDRPSMPGRRCRHG